MLEINKIYCADCLEKMKEIENKSIDCILADLPYQITACSWDTIIPFEPLWEQYKRIIKDNGAIVLTASQPFTSKLVMSNLEMFKYEWIWEKTIASGNLTAKYQPMRNHESVLVFCSGKTKYNPIKQKRSKNTHTSKGGEYKIKSDNRVGIAINKPQHPDDLVFPTTVKLFSSVPRPHCKHPTQKPIKLGQYLIKTYTNKGDLVLDNCCGSGSFLIAAILEERNYIGIEKEEKYCEISKKRINEIIQKI